MPINNLQDIIASGVIDTHVHLTPADRKLDGNNEDSYHHGITSNPWLDWWDLTKEKKVTWTEDDLLLKMTECQFKLNSAIFVECSNSPSLEEAKWALSLVEDKSKSLIAGVIANIPVPDGPDAVKEFLSQLKKTNNKLPVGLKGGRVVLLQNPEKCLSKSYLDGLDVLYEENLIWEWCCKPDAIPFITQVIESKPDMVFILDHLGHNQGGYDFDTWSMAITELGRKSNLNGNSNLYVKMGAIEEWKIDDKEMIGKFLDHAIDVFGFKHILYESNWFVSDVLLDQYNQNAVYLYEALVRKNATDADIMNVFRDNAKTVYKL